MKGSYIGLMGNDTPALLIGLIGILQSGNCLVPINPIFPNDRIDYIIKDCGIKVLLTDRFNYEKARQIADTNPFIEHLLCIDDEVEKVEPGWGTGDGNQEKDIGEDVDDPCYIIYTSGSTGQPKGVPITHRNLIPLFSWFRDYFGLNSHTRVMQNLSYTFDFGLFEILTTLIYGGCLYQSDKRSIGDFAFYSRYINVHFINTIHSTPVFFSHVVSSAGENMPSLQLVHLGGERLTGKIVKNISRVVPSECRIHNGYGPTETTINCSIFTLTAARGAAVGESASIPIGRPTAWNILYILGKHYNPQPVGVAGELCVAGAGVADGYLNQPELTIEKFLSTFNRSYKSYRSYIPKKIYKTGDLARWLKDGNIEFLGRIDFQVKVRGFRIELGEIESCLLKYPGTREAVVIAKEHENGSHYLCAYVVSGSNGPLTVSQLREHLLKELPDYMIPAYFIPLEQMPLTTSGKVDRKRLPEPDESTITTGVAYVAPVTDIEKKLVKIWQVLLKLEKIGLMDDFFELGGDSIMANQCIARIREELQIEVPLRKFFERPYIKALSEEIGKQERGATAIPRASRDGLIPLSFAQERLWFLQELDTENVAYFVPRVIRIKGKIEKELFERTFSEIIRRHEILRTRFLTVEGLPVQHIDPPYEFKIPVIDWSGAAESQQSQEVAEWLKEEGRRKFNFETGPMLRVTLLKLKPGEHLLVLTEHHLVHDGWTQGVLLREFVTIFTTYSRGLEHQMPELPIQYADFAIWQRELMQGEVLENHLNYWKNKLWGLPPVLELPYDRPRPSVISGQGALLDFHLSGPLTPELEEFSRRNNVTLFMTMLAVFKVLLYRYSGVGDFCVGTGIANRRYKEMEGMLGMVINSLPLRTRLDGNLPFNRLLHRVKETCLEAYQHEDTPFGQIVEIMQPERSLSYSPIFQVLYSFMDTPTEDMRLPGLELDLLESHNRSSKFDINIVVVPPVEQEDSGETLIEWEYNTDIFEEDTMNRMIAHYIGLLEAVIKTPGEPISRLDMLTESEIRQLLVTFNETAVDYPFNKLLHQLFEEQVEKAPHQIALVGQIPNKEEPFGQSINAFGGNIFITYKELDQKSNQLAYLLREKGVQGDTIVGIMVERSIEMMVGLLGILKAGGAYLPIDPEYPAERKQYMLDDSDAGVLFTTPDLSGKHEKLKIVNGQLSIVNCQRQISRTSAAKKEHLHLSPWVNAPATSLAYVIYTSGSTGKPKGVMVQHGNVVNFITGMTICMDFEPDKRILAVTTITFDIFVVETWLPLSLGMQVVIANEEQRMDPQLLSEIITRYNIDKLQVTPSRLILLYNVDHRLACLQGVGELIVGGEAFPAHLLGHLQEVYPGKFYNIYGPTETTVWSTVKELTGCKTVTIGVPIANTQVYIVDRYNCLQPPGAPGELLIGGDGVTRGYLNNPGLTAEKIISATKTQRHKEVYFSWCPGALVAKLYKTGDLARWLRDGNIEFLGRMDHQVKVRGFRIELGEIENQLLKHEEIKEAAVAAHENKNRDKYLAAYVVSSTSGEISIPGLREYLTTVLPDYMVPSYFVQMEEIPLTTTGKTDRKALPLPEAKADVEYIAPRSEIERKLADIWSEILSPAGHLSIGINDNFFLLGGHSLKATQVVSKIHKAFNVKLPLMQMFKRPTVKKLSGYIREAAEDKYGAIEAAEKREYYALSSAQRRLYILQQIDEHSISESTSTNSGKTIAYNISTVSELEGELQSEKLEETLKALIARHESLRTSFVIVGEEPVQKIHDEVEFEIEYYNLATGAIGANSKQTVPFGQVNAFGGKEGIKNTEGTRGLAPLSKDPATRNPQLATSTIGAFIRPFDLSRMPLLRVGLIQEGNTGNKYILIVDMHHIISDGISTGILAGEFMVLYSGRKPMSLKIQYKDYTLWQTREDEKERLNQQKAWWMEEFTGEIPMLNLPLDYPRPPVQSFEGSRLVFETGAEELKAIRKLALAKGVTLYMVLLTAYSILLSRLSGQEEIVIGAPVSGRRHPDLESIMGMFVNTLVMRTYSGGNKTFNAFLNQIKEKTLKAFENQEYPFEELVEQVVVTRDPSRNPLFDAAFILQNVEIPAVKMPGLTLFPYHYDNKIAKFDLTLQVFERETAQTTGTMDSEGKLEFILEYCTRLFKPETIRKFVGYFKKILSHIIEKSNEKISGIEIISEAEKRKIIMDFNATAAEYPGDKTIAQLFEEQVERTPDRAALIGNCQWSMVNGQWSTEILITYQELNQKSHQLAQALKEKGVHSAIIVGIIAEPSLEMVIGILGILKAGGAYLPIDPEYPEDRINYMLKDSNAKVLVTASTFAEEGEKVNRTPQLAARKSQIAYVIYTSGSTGRPKGVAVGHQSLVNLCYWHNNHFSITTSDRATKLAGFGFDASVWEIFPYLIAGASLYMVNTEIRTDILQLNTYFERHDITTAFLPTQLCEQFITLENRSLRLLLTGGDKLKKYHPTPYQLVNNYGPTENTVVTTSFPVIGDSRNISIGSPIYNTRVYILDKYHHLQPVGVPGELCIAGDSLAVGYLNRPELTAERFLSISYKSYTSYKTYISKKMYKSGDLARWLADGNIEFLGRTDLQVKIRGYRIELEEIGNRLLGHYAVAEAVVIDGEHSSGDRYLCAYIVPVEPFSQTLDSMGLREHLSQTLPDYMVPDYFVFLPGIPLTPNGKIDRQALPAPGLQQGKETYVTPRNQIEKTLAKIWAEVLGSPVPIGIDDNFFDIGGHSLKATRLITRIHKELNTKIPLAKVFKTPTIRSISQYIKRTGQNIYASIPEVEKKEYYPVSSAQKRMFILHHLKGHDTSDNTPYAVMVEGKSDKEHLEQVVKQLIQRHEPLRTSFYLLDETPVQGIQPEVDFEIEYFRVGVKSEPEGTGDLPPEVGNIIKRFIRPFDLGKPPLLRVGLVQLSPQKYLFIHDIHHIIRDGTTSWIFVREFIELYKGNQLPELRIQYKDFTAWQNRMLESEVIKKQEAYWLEVFSEEIPVLNMPTDFPRPGAQSFEGDYIEFILDKEPSAKVRQLALAHGATLYMSLLAVYTILLSKYSGQEDIVVGTPIAGRPHADLENLIGMFVNTLAMRNYPTPMKTFAQFLKEVKDNALKAYENQDYQFEVLVNRLGIAPDPARQSLFDTMFAVQNMAPGGPDSQNQLIKGLVFKRLKFEEKITQFDIMFHAIESGDIILFRLLYCTRLFKEETIRLFIQNFKEIIGIVTNNKDIKLKDIAITHGLFNQEIEVPGADFEF